jgi:hypothetical protein
MLPADIYPMIYLLLGFVCVCVCERERLHMYIQDLVTFYHISALLFLCCTDVLYILVLRDFRPWKLGYCRCLLLKYTKCCNSTVCIILILSLITIYIYLFI